MAAPRRRRRTSRRGARSSRSIDELADRNVRDIRSPEASTMKKILFCSLLLALSTTVASAAGLSLRWNACVAGGGVQDNSFACDADDQVFDLIGQFQMPTALSGVTGVEFVVDIAFEGAVVPAWWKFNAGECRDSQLNALTGSPSPAQCPDWAANGGVGGLAAYNEAYFGPNTAHILGGWAVPPTKARNLTATPNYFAFKLEITSTGTVAAPVCGGCNLGACIVFRGLKAALPPVDGQPDGSVIVTGPRAAGSDFATWRGGANVTTLLGTGCPRAVPVRDSSWGAVKA